MNAFMKNREKWIPPAQEGSGFAPYTKCRYFITSCVLHYSYIFTLLAIPVIHRDYDYETFCVLLISPFPSTKKCCLTTFLLWFFGYVVSFRLRKNTTPSLCKSSYFLHKSSIQFNKTHPHSFCRNFVAWQIMQIQIIVSPNPRPGLHQ